MGMLKKVDLSRTAAFLFFFLIGVLLYLFSRVFLDYKDYSQTKREIPDKNRVIQKFSPLRNPPASASREQILRFDPFSEDRRALSIPGNTENTGSLSGYKIIGVIKAKQFFVVVQNPSDKKTKLLPKGGDLGEAHTIEDIFPQLILVRGPDGKLKRVKVFEYQEVKRERESLPVRKG